MTERVVSVPVSLVLATFDALDVGDDIAVHECLAKMLDYRLTADEIAGHVDTHGTSAASSLRWFMSKFMNPEPKTLKIEIHTGPDQAVPVGDVQPSEVVQHGPRFYFVTDNPAEREGGRSLVDLESGNLQSFSPQIIVTRRKAVISIEVP